MPKASETIQELKELGGLKELRTMKFTLVMTLAVTNAVAQTATVRITNATRPSARDFQIGDRYMIEIIGAPSQPISVRTTGTGRTDWGPVIAHTDTTGRWSTTGRFEKSDFGSLEAARPRGGTNWKGTLPEPPRRVGTDTLKEFGQRK
jgi:hypothetical protein